MERKNYSRGITKFVRGLVAERIIDFASIWPLVQKDFPSVKEDSLRTILWEERLRAGISGSESRSGLYPKVRKVMAEKEISSFEELKEELDKRGISYSNMETLQSYFFDTRRFSKTK